MAVWAFLSLYQFLRDQENLPLAWQYIRQSLTGPRFYIPVIVFLMMFLNWFLEILKWQLLVKPYESISIRFAAKVVLSSLSIGLATPNRTGEYGVRAYYMQPHHRATGVLLTILSSVSQLLVTLIAGIWAGISFLPAVKKGFVTLRLSEGWHLLLLGISFLLLWFLLFLFFRTSSTIRMLKKISLFQKWLPSEPELEVLTNPLRFRILILSILRYIIFSTQLFLIWDLFGAGLTIDQSYLCIAWIYMLMAFVPTFALAEIGIRGQVSVWVAGVFTTNYLALLTGTLVLWLVNLGIPALVGTFFLWRMRLQRRKKHAECR